MHSELDYLKMFLAALRRIKLGEGKTDSKKPGRAHTQVLSVSYHRT